MNASLSGWRRNQTHRQSPPQREGREEDEGGRVEDGSMWMRNGRDPRSAHRNEVIRMHRMWQDASEEVDRLREELTRRENDEEKRQQWWKEEMEARERLLQRAATEHEELTQTFEQIESAHAKIKAELLGERKLREEILQKLQHVEEDFEEYRAKHSNMLERSQQSLFDQDERLESRKKTILAQEARIESQAEDIRFLKLQIRSLELKNEEMGLEMQRLSKRDSSTGKREFIDPIDRFESDHGSESLHLSQLESRSLIGSRVSSHGEHRSDVVRKNIDESSIIEVQEENEMLRRNIRRLFAVVRTIPEFESFFEYGEEFDFDISYVSQQDSNLSSQKSPSLQTSLLRLKSSLMEPLSDRIVKNGKSEKLFWIPTQIYDVLNEFRSQEPTLSEIPDSIFDVLLVRWNRIWCDREKRKITRLKKKYDDLLEDARRQVDTNAPWDKIYLQNRIRYLVNRLFSKSNKETPVKRRRNSHLIQPREFSLDHSHSSDIFSSQLSRKQRSQSLSPVSRRPRSRRSPSASSDSDFHVETSLRGLSATGDDLSSFWDGAVWFGEKLVVLAKSLSNRVNEAIRDLSFSFSNSSRQGHANRLTDANHICSNLSSLVSAMLEAMEHLLELCRSVCSGKADPKELENNVLLHAKF